MTGSRHEQQASTHTATGIAPDSHRIPSSLHLHMSRYKVMMLFGREIISHLYWSVNHRCTVRTSCFILFLFASYQILDA
jgi:hypothetical protein